MAGHIRATRPVPVRCCGRTNCPGLLLYTDGGPGYGGVRFQWSADSARVRFTETDRGYTAHRLKEIDAATGAVRVVVEEVDELSINGGGDFEVGQTGEVLYLWNCSVFLCCDCSLYTSLSLPALSATQCSLSVVSVFSQYLSLCPSQVLWVSERDGHHHLYLYGAGGALKAQLTAGPWQVRGVLRLDPAARCVYFSASGR